MPLKAEAAPCWHVRCDECGNGDEPEYGGTFHYASEDEARRQLLGAEWVELQDGRWVCPECSDSAASEAAPS